MHPLPARPGAFQRGCRDTFSLRTPPLGELAQVVVQHSSGSNAAWYLDRLELLHVGSGARYVCSFRAWLNSQRGGRKAARARRLGADVAAGQCTYELVVTSSNVPGGCWPGISLVLHSCSAGVWGWR
jgi:hypothetical protein